jgi:hypothetical protein
MQKGYAHYLKGQKQEIAPPNLEEKKGTGTLSRGYKWYIEIVEGKE